MTDFEIVFFAIATLMGLGALFGYLNHRVLKLPHTIGLMIITLAFSLAVLLVDLMVPMVDLKTPAQDFMERVHFYEALMHCTLSFLLFAGALHVNLDDLLERKFAISTLATVGVLISTFLVGFLSWLLFRWLGFSVDWGFCLIFGALISPTDPVAVLGLLKNVKAPRSLEAKIAGESLFNDGVGIVVFLVLVAFFVGGGGDVHAGADSAGVSAETPQETIGVAKIVIMFLKEVLGGAALGLLFGYVAYRAMKSIDQYQLEVLITLACVMLAYSVAGALHFSGPIAVVLAGLLIGNQGKRFAMSPVTVDHVEKFWSLIDEILNSMLFLLIGLEIFLVPMGSFKLVLAALLSVPVVLLSRFVSVSIPISILSVRRQFSRGVIPILTWSGLRGGISVALVLFLSQNPAIDPETLKLLLVSTYMVVLFSVIVQGLTVKPLLKWFMQKES